jgi:hypothetical protein
MMSRLPIRIVATVAAVCVAIAIAVAVLVSTGAGPALHAPESIFQDDNHLLYASRATVASTLDVLKTLGVDRIRVTVEWAYIAPDASSPAKPAGFNAANPADYPAGAWSRYDQVAEMAAARGIGIDFNITGPGPVWAMKRAPARMRSGASSQDYEPSASAFGQFVHALGVRYSGSYVPGGTTSTGSGGGRSARALPRVAFWSIWNEPNQPAWIAPQWVTRGRLRVPESPRLYRGLVDAAVGALEATGHTLAKDTILIGETAPEGDVTLLRGTHPQRYVSSTGSDDSMTPMVFLRALYCVSSSYQPLTGAQASALGCPTHGSAKSFVSKNPGLFYATGFAHHPYFLGFAPNVSSPIADYVPLADLPRLERGLDEAYAAYGVNRKIPIYLTEYGYQTNPPAPTQSVTPAQQAAYLNEADYMAWRDPRVRSVAQFLLYDSGPNTNYPPSSPNYWGSMFQTGLIYGPGTHLDGRPKPSLAAYALPIWIPDPTPRRGSKMLIWGMLRLAPKRTNLTAQIQWRGSGRAGYRTIATAAVPASATYGYFTTAIAPPGAGSIRIAWRSAAGKTFKSRAVKVGGKSASAFASANATVLTGAGSVSQAYDLSQTIPPCEFTPAQLQQAEDSVSNDEMQYGQGFVAAIANARQQQASGACAATRRSAQTTTTAPGTPTPPPAPSLGHATPLDVGSAIAPSSSGVPAPILILIILGGLLAITGAAFGAARLGGWDPPQAVRWRHSWSEAGDRAYGAWSRLDDWRRRRGR